MNTAAAARALTCVEKIIKNHLVAGSRGEQALGCGGGGIVSIRPKHVMTHDNTAAVMPKFQEIWELAGKEPKVESPNQPVFTLDHNIQDRSEENIAKYSRIENFANKHGISFFPAGRGIGHQVMVEEGFLSPGSLVVASDSHSNMYGGLGCLGTPIVRSDAASIWCTGQTWWQTPPVAKVEITGSLVRDLHVSGKDVILALCGAAFKDDEVLNHAIEFVGEGVSGLTVEERLTIANMTTEWGAIAGLFPVDDVLATWIEKKVKKFSAHDHPRWNDEMMQSLENALSTVGKADPGAFYSKHLSLDLSSVTPQVTGPNNLKIATPIHRIEKEKVKVDKAYLVSCVNSRLSDIASAASILKGKKVHEGVQMYVAAASSVVQKEAEEQGHWQTLIDAGATILPPGCGPCIGLGMGLLEDGEVGISATNRNFKGRMGSRNAKAYLASPAIVATSALNGYISGPPTLAAESSSSSSNTDLRYHEDKTSKSDADEIDSSSSSSSSFSLHPQFPEQISGRVIFCNADNINTDGIYPGTYTYKDMTLEEQAKVVMSNYDEEFVRIQKSGDVLVSGANFGSGSSREQAATALLAAGIRVVIAHSFSETFKRNAWNNGLIVLEAPKVVAELRREHNSNTEKEKTSREKGEITVDFAKGVITHHDSGVKSKFDSIGQIAQEMVVEGSLVTWAAKALGGVDDKQRRL